MVDDVTAALREGISDTPSVVVAEFDELARFKALRADSESREHIGADSLWAELTCGRARVRDCFFTDTDCLIAIESVTPSGRTDRRVLPRKLRVLERVLLRGGQKSVAAELGLAPSTVAIIAGGCLRAMGMDSGASRAPLPLWVAVHAFHRNTQFDQARASTITHAGRVYRVLSVPRPELRLKGSVSPAEFAVLRLLVEGLSHQEMAALRHTSVRTIANQLASAFHKLGVSGRSELLCGLVARHSEFPSLSGNTPSEPVRVRATPSLAIADAVNA